MATSPTAVAAGTAAATLSPLSNAWTWLKAQAADAFHNHKALVLICVGAGFLLAHVL